MRVHIATADVPNANGRIYPRKLLEKFVEKGDVFGEISLGDEPSGDSSELSVNLEKVSHVVKNMRFEGDDLVGDVRVLPTPRGEVLKTLLASCGVAASYSAGLKPRLGDPEQPSPIGFRPRGRGRVENGTVIEYSLVAVDVVKDPA